MSPATIGIGGRIGVKPIPGVSMTLQEQAYTSPMGYTPGRS